MAKQEYPKWRYGLNGQRVKVFSEAELQQLGPNWYDSPAKVPQIPAGDAPSVDDSPGKSTADIDNSPEKSDDSDPSPRKKRGRPPKMREDDG